MLKMYKLNLFRDGNSTWSVFWVMMKRYKSAMGGELPRTILEMDPKVLHDLENEKWKPKKHPGRFASKITHLPERFVEAAQLILQDYPQDNLKIEAKKLCHHLFARMPPMESEQLLEKSNEIEANLILNDHRFSQPPPTNDEEREVWDKTLRQKVMRKLRAVTYQWKPMNYDNVMGLKYLLMRAAPEYAVLTSIFKELKRRNEEFQPEAVLDFGSGVGTVFWASYEQWGGRMKEYFAVDTSGDMNNIAQLLVQDGCEGKTPILKATFFRQFLPATHILTYDLVVSAYTLMELPSRELRLQTLENLWAKTNEFLIIVENGSNAGYNLVQEAREFILKASRDDVHVFAPCSHDHACPKIPIGIPCNFEAGYSTLSGKQDVLLTERYSYVVLRKRRRPDGAPWPRIVAPVLPRGRHVVCRMCCADGHLKEIVVTAAKHGKPLYKCARASTWGDLIPAYQTGDSISIEEKNRSKTQSEMAECTDDSVDDK